MDNGVMMQYFEWYLDHKPHLWTMIKENAQDLKNAGITAVWLPPAFKGIGGKNEVGYAVYDIYDLGEFEACGTVCTKYGTKDEYLRAIQALHQNHIQVYGDIVLNHMMGADGMEYVKAYEVNQLNKNEVISDEEMIKVPTLFTFPSRHQKYSDFTWNWTCFDGIDYDGLSKRHATFLFKDKSWEQEVDHENGNFDYLMGADIDFSCQKVVDELECWGKWYLDLTGLDGLRLDALKHISASFYKDWLQNMRQHKQSSFFTVGEYWHGDVYYLLDYLNQVNQSMSLFDVPLHYRFYEASLQKDKFDLSQILKDTLVEKSPLHAVTFVDNHDTQPSQGLQSWVEDWFKPLAYALILLRKDGYPCLFYGDYYGIAHDGIKPIQSLLNQLLFLRKHYATGWQKDYFHNQHVIGWTREGGLACLMSNKESSHQWMYVGEKYAGSIYVDALGNCFKKIVINEQGYGDFEVEKESVSVYILLGEDNGL